MKIRKLLKSLDWSMRNPNPNQPIETDRDMTMAFAVTEDNSMWMAVHQCINEIEQETIGTARRCSANPNLVNYHVGASEGVTMVRTRLIEKRNLALKELNQKAG